MNSDTMPIEKTNPEKRASDVHPDETDKIRQGETRGMMPILIISTLAAALVLAIALGANAI